MRDNGVSVGWPGLHSKLHPDGSDLPGAAPHAAAWTALSRAGTCFPAAGTSSSARGDYELRAVDSPSGKAVQSKAQNQTGRAAGWPALRYLPVRTELAGTGAVLP